MHWVSRCKALPATTAARMAVFMDGHAEYVPEAEVNARIAQFMSYATAP